MFCFLLFLYVLRNFALFLQSFFKKMHVFIVVFCAGVVFALQKYLFLGVVNANTGFSVYV